MPGVWKRAAYWLGLIDEERYADDPVDLRADDDGVDEAEADDQASDLAEVTPLPVSPEGRPEGYATGGAVYPLPITARGFDDAERIGEAYRDGVAVVVDLSKLPSDQARRLHDFDTGLTFGLKGKLEPLAPKTFLLSPKGVVVSAEERRRLLTSLARAA